MTKAILIEDFEHLKAGKELDVIPMDMFWLSEEERGGLCVVLGMMSYIRISNPDGSPTQWSHLFKLK